MKCFDARRQLSALLDLAQERASETSPRDAVARHVDACHGCRAELDALSDVDKVVAKGLGLAAATAQPANYFEEFLPRLEARLDAERHEEDHMSMSTSGSGERGDPAGSGDRPKTDVAGKPVNKVEEVSGLHDIRALAASSIREFKEQHGDDNGEVADALLVSASPAALGQVVLPAPGKEVTQPIATIRGSAGAGVGVTAVDSMTGAAGSRSRLGPAVFVFGGALAIAAAIVVYVVMDGRKTNPVATAPQAADQPAAPERTAASEAPKGADGLAARGVATNTPPAAPPTPEPVADPAALPAVTPTDDPAAKPEGAVGTMVAKADEGTPGKDSKEPKKAPGEKDPKPGDVKAVDKPVDDKAPEQGAVEPVPDEKKPVVVKTKQDEEIDAILGDAAKKDDKKEAVEAPSEEIPAQLSREDIKQGMGKVRARVQTCYDKFKIPGTVSIKLKIEQDGSVSSADATDKFAATETGLCVSSAVQTAKFRRFSGPPITIKYPFKLE